MRNHHSRSFTCLQTNFCLFLPCARPAAIFLHLNSLLLLILLNRFIALSLKSMGLHKLPLYNKVYYVHYQFKTHTSRGEASSQPQFFYVNNSNLFFMLFSTWHPCHRLTWPFALFLSSKITFMVFSSQLPSPNRAKILGSL